MSWVVFDVGEVLIDESRIWSTWADVLRIPRLTFMGVLGGVIARGGELPDVFAALGQPSWQRFEPRVQQRYGGFAAQDLYADALPTLVALRAGGLRVGVVGNQPANRREELLALGVDVDVMAMSDALGAAKPDPEFFARVRSLCGGAADIAYVGDRVDNDVEASAAAGMRAIWLRRGPWGLLQSDDTGASAAVCWDLREVADVLLIGPCPTCGGRLQRLVYGKPGPSASLERFLQRGSTVLAGCLRGDATHRCVDCRKEVIATA